MNVFIVGVTGGVGLRAAKHLIAAGHKVSGIVRRSEQIDDLSAYGIFGRLGDLVSDTTASLAEAMRGCDLVLFTAGSGSDNPADTTAVDGKGPGKIGEAMKIAGIKRLYLVSVFPEAYRGHPLDKGFEHYIEQKKSAEIELVRTELDWVILRPSELTDEPGQGNVDLGLAEAHTRIPRDDVSQTLVALMETPRVNRVILEVTQGSTPLRQAVSALSF